MGITKGFRPEDPQNSPILAPRQDFRLRSPEFRTAKGFLFAEVLADHVAGEAADDHILAKLRNFAIGSQVKSFLQNSLRRLLNS